MLPSPAAVVRVDQSPVVAGPLPAAHVLGQAETSTAPGARSDVYLTGNYVRQA